jgi:hypothetical protein
LHFVRSLVAEVLIPNNVDSVASKYVEIPLDLIGVSCCLPIQETTRKVCGARDPHALPTEWFHLESHLKVGEILVEII